MITLAFDAAFDSNNLVYAADFAADKGIYRFNVESSCASDGGLEFIPS
jgi:hypothetical protein